MKRTRKKQALRRPTESEIFNLRVRMMALGKNGRYLADRMEREDSTISEALKGKLVTLFWRIEKHIAYLERQKRDRESVSQRSMERAANTLRSIG